jgi:hypothetical protein
MPRTVVCGNTRRREEYYRLPPNWTLARRFNKIVMILLLSCSIGSWFFNVVLNFCSKSRWSEKTSPPPSTVWLTEASSQQSDGSLGFRFSENSIVFLPGPSLDLGPHLTLRELGLRRKLFHPCCRCLQKGLARDIDSQLVMVIPLTLIRSITRPGCPAILHAASLGLQCYSF